MFRIAVFANGYASNTFTSCLDPYAHNFTYYAMLLLKKSTYYAQ